MPTFVRTNLVMDCFRIGDHSELIVKFGDNRIIETIAIRTIVETVQCLRFHVSSDNYRRFTS